MVLKNKPCKLLDIHNKNQIFVVAILFYVLVLRIMCPPDLDEPTNTLKKCPGHNDGDLMLHFQGDTFVHNACWLTEIYQTMPGTQ